MADNAYVKDVPLNQKLNLTVYEAAAYSGIGIVKIREMMRRPDCPFILKAGEYKQLIRRAEFEKYLDDKAKAGASV